MKLLALTLFSSFILSSSIWTTNFDDAKKTAQEKHEFIVLNFSGSDWCVPCIRLHKDIFDSDDFKNYAADHLILVNADFPRLKKNQLSKDQIKLNEALADKYNPKGIFPLTLLLNADGKIIKSFEGFPNASALEFTNQIKQIINAAN
jgi:thioredoxin-related protein